VLKHYATHRKFAACISDEVVGFFNWANPSSRTMALRSTQSLTEVSTRNLTGGKGRPASKADLIAICGRLPRENVEAYTSHNPIGLQGLLQGELYLFLCRSRGWRFRAVITWCAETKQVTSKVLWIILCKLSLLILVVSLKKLSIKTVRMLHVFREWQIFFYKRKIVCHGEKFSMTI
jgi:hypothetical protein